MSTVLIRTVFLTGFLLFEKIHCVPYEGFQTTPPPDFSTTTVTSTDEWGTSTYEYEVTTTVEETSFNPQPSAFSDWPSPPPSNIKLSKREITPETLTASTVVSTPDSVTEITINTTADPVTATTWVITPQSETYTSVDTAIEFERLGAASMFDAQKECPPKQSLISQKDIRIIVKFQINHMNLTNFENRFFDDIITLKENIKGDFQKFISWFEERPSHLKHILEYLKTIRERIQKVLSKKNTGIQDYSVLENEYNAKLEKVEKLMKKIQKYKNICKYNCDEESSHETRRLNPSFVEKRQSETNATSSTINQITNATSTKDEENYYCSNIDKLVDRVKDLLLKYERESEQIFKIRIANDTKMYKEQVEELKNVSKSKALSQFGTTMYDLLNLQDQYYHFEQELQVDSQARIRNIRTLISNMGASLVDLEYQAEKLRKYCSTCSSFTSLRRRFHRAADDIQTAPTEGETNKGDLLDNITLDVYQDYLNEALVAYQTVFKELDDVIAKSKNENIANLQQLQAEIVHMTAQETEEMQKLKTLLPENSIDKIVELENKAADLDQKMQTVSKELKEKYKSPA